MKNLFLRATLIVALALGVKSMYAQDVHIATLQHGENMKVFYGADGLKDALAAAVQGDLITLSAGTFNAATINKGVTIQGAGYVTDEENGRYPTTITGEWEIKGGAENITIEGVYNGATIYLGRSGGDDSYKLPIVGLTIKKCRLSKLSTDCGWGNAGQTANCTIVQCRIADRIDISGMKQENFLIKNSIISILCETKPTSTVSVENCVLSVGPTNAMFKNSILFGGMPLQTSSAYNNVLINANIDIVSVKSGNMFSDENTLFGKGIYNYTDTETYELTESARATFLGTDGTQVGIFGGSNPFTDVPTNPQIVSKSIETKSSADGKLKVNITVKAQNK